jgi:hypothetical protein
MKTFLKNMAVTVLLLAGLETGAQTANVTDIIRQKDSIFWIAYNSCDVDGMKPFIADDVEFYHDKGGITLGWENFRNSIKNNLCGTNGYRLRREAVPNTVTIFPMNKDGNAYGAVISGQHYFYITETGKKERRDGLAKFTHLWLLKDGNWKMSRILSYDHGPAPYINKRKAIKLTSKILASYSGTYSTKNGPILVSNEKGSLFLASNGQKFELFPEGQNVFFVKERDLTFEFSKNEKNKADKIIVREFGEVVEEDPLVK